MVRKSFRSTLCRFFAISCLFVILQAVIFFGFLEHTPVPKIEQGLDYSDPGIVCKSAPSKPLFFKGERNEKPFRGGYIKRAPGQKRVERPYPLGPCEGENLYFGKYSVKYQLGIHELTVEGANPHEFNYYMKPEPCVDNKELFLLIFIHSRPENFLNRETIRKTWGNPDNFHNSKQQNTLIRTVFVMGLSKNDSLDDLLDKENAQYHDLIQEDFIDHYRNMTYKHMAAYKWVSQNCMESRYVLKADDDVMTNIFDIVRHLQHIAQTKIDEYFIMGAITAPFVFRTKGEKWYVSPELYRDSRYQNYAMGLAYITTTQTVAQMFKASLTTPFYWLDDVYVGILAAKIGGVNFHRINGKVWPFWLRDDIDTTFLENGYLFAHLQGTGLNFIWTIFNQLLDRENLPRIDIPERFTSRTLPESPSLMKTYLANLYGHIYSMYANVVSRIYI